MHRKPALTLGDFESKIPRSLAHRNYGAMYKAQMKNTLISVVAITNLRVELNKIIYSLIDLNQKRKVLNFIYG